ncbi:MAG: hypothetical protein Fur0020_10360 [Thermodesulfovibrionia bacterium]
MKENQSSMTNYLFICEIGPIDEFVQETRKTVDFWGASFVFSFLMSHVAKEIKAQGGTIFLPYLDDDPLVSDKGKVTCGSVPDRIYAIIKGDKKDEFRKVLNIAIQEGVKRLIDEIKKEGSLTGVTLNEGEITEFFNFFYIFHEIKGDKPDYDEFLEAERKISIRYALRPFEQLSVEMDKWKKCDLCGKRKMVYEVRRDFTPGAEFHNVERICSVCIIKRFLPDGIKGMFGNNKGVEFIEPAYKSTSDIAAIPIITHLNKLEYTTDCYDNVKTLVEKVKQEYREKLKEESKRVGKGIIPDIDEGRSFFDVSLPSLRNFREEYRKCEKTIKETNKDCVPLRWLDRPFFSVVYMDGDNMGDILKANKDNFPDYVSSVSKLIASFSRGVYDIITKKYDGQLIFAGGEDITFIIHPEFLLECISELATSYNKIFQQDNLTRDNANMFTLSAGAVIAYHKYPLSRVIKNSYKMLTEHAKSHPNKDATAISLIKGHTEVLRFSISNTLIDNLIDLKGLVLKSHISRTTPYRIYESKEILQSISDDDSRRNYLRSILEATRDLPRDIDIEELVAILMRFGDIDTMIDALLFARFLAGERDA